MPDAGLLSGLSAGVVSTAVLHPIDLIKVRFQVQDVVAAGTSPKRRYTSIFGAARSIFAEEGVRGFYKGIVPGLTGSGVSWGLYFFFYERLKRNLSGHLGFTTMDGKLGPHHHMACAVMAGCSTVVFTNPIWLVKTRMQLQTQEIAKEGGKTPYRGMIGEQSTPLRGMTWQPNASLILDGSTDWKGQCEAGGDVMSSRCVTGADALRCIVREDGIRGLYRGVGPALLLTSHGAVQFAAYEEIRLVDAPPWLKPLWMLSAGAASKAVATTVTYPYQVIKARIQARDSVYKGVLDCATDAWK